MDLMRCPCRRKDDRSADDLWLNAENRWPFHIWPISPLRVCSHCSGFHPDDVVRLIRDFGYCGMPSNTEGKMYLVPPGCLEVEARRARGETLPASIKGPPAKTYLQHYDPETAAALFSAVVIGNIARRAGAKQ